MQAGGAAAPSPSKEGAPAMQHITEINDRIVRRITGGEYVESERLLLQLLETIKRTAYPDTRLKYLHETACHYNLACIYQKIWKNQECCAHLERSIDFQELELKQSNDEVERMARQIDLIRCLLQYCAVLSQLNNHVRALEISKHIVRTEKDIFGKCRNLCERRLEEHRSNSPTNSNLVRFETILIEEALEKLRFLAEIPDADAVLSTYQATYNAISESIYYWKNIPENNERLMRKELRLGKPTVAVRNVLGVCKTDDWADSFNIGSLLHIVSAKCILEQVFYTSIGYFTIATEIRFKEVEADVNGLKLNQKQVRLSQNEFVKAYHLKAIELAGRFVSTSSQYINHLILSFNKNYKASMDPINEQSFNVNDSIMGSRDKQLTQSVEGSIHRSLPPEVKYESVNFCRKSRAEEQKVQTEERPRDEEVPRKEQTPVELRRIRSNTKETAQRLATHQQPVIKRQNRIKSDQTFQKCHEIKTFTFKFVKEVKESRQPSSKKNAKKRSVSRKRR